MQITGGKENKAREQNKYEIQIKTFLLNYKKYLQLYVKKGKCISQNTNPV